MKPVLVTLTCLLFALSTAISQTTILDLVNKSGRKIQAQILAVTDDSVKVRITGKGEYELKLDTLSEESQAHLREWAQAQNPEAAGTASCPAVMLKPLELAVDDPISAESWAANWQKAKGQFTAMEDHVVAEEILAEDHAAGAGRIHSMNSGILQIDFRMDDTTNTSFGLDYTSPEKKDHLLRVNLKDGKLSVTTGSGWGSTTKMKPIGPGVPVELNEDDWNTSAVEFYGQEILVHLNGAVVYHGISEPNLEVEKNRIALVSRGKASFRNVKYWPGEADSTWEDRKRRVLREIE